VNLRSDRHARTSPRGWRLGPNGDGAGKGPGTATPRGRSGTRSIAGTYPRAHSWSGTWKPRIFARSMAAPDLSSPAPSPPAPAGRDRSGPRTARSSLPLSGGQESFRHGHHSRRQADRKESPWRCGTGCWKKPMPACNEPATGRTCPARKGAHVQQVLRRERAWRTVLTREGDRRL